jgi:hypothetical protein
MTIASKWLIYDYAMNAWCCLEAATSLFGLVQSVAVRSSTDSISLKFERNRQERGWKLIPQLCRSFSSATMMMTFEMMRTTTTTTPPLPPPPPPPPPPQQHQQSQSQSLSQSMMITTIAMMLMVFRALDSSPSVQCPWLAPTNRLTAVVSCVHFTSCIHYLQHTK